MLGIVHCLRHIWKRRCFMNSLYSRLHIISCYYTDTFVIAAFRLIPILAMCVLKSLSQSVRLNAFIGKWLNGFPQNCIKASITKICSNIHVLVWNRTKETDNLHEDQLAFPRSEITGCGILRTLTSPIIHKGSKIGKFLCVESLARIFSGPSQTSKEAIFWHTLLRDSFEYIISILLLSPCQHTSTYQKMFLVNSVD